MQIHAHVLVLAIYVQACTNKKTSNTHTLSIAKNKPLKTGAKISYWFRMPIECNIGEDIECHVQNID